MHHLKKYTLTATLSLFGFYLPVFAQNNNVPNNTSATVDTPQKSPLTEDELTIVKSNLDNAIKLLRIAQYCPLPDEKDSVTTFQLYAHSLIASTAFIRPNEVSPSFVKNIQEKINHIMNDSNPESRKCALKDRDTFVSFNQKINGNILTAIYTLLSDEKTFVSDIKNKNFANFTPEELLIKKFFSQDYEIYPKKTSSVLYSNHTRKPILNNSKNIKHDEFSKTNMQNFVFAIAGLQSLEKCYQKVGLTENEKNIIKPKLTKFVKESINQSDIPNINRLSLLLTGAVVADTIDKDKCSYTLKSIKFLEQFDTKLSTKKTSSK